MAEEEEAFRVTDRRGRPNEASSPGPAAEPRPSEPVPSGARPETAAPETPRSSAPGPDLQGLFIMFASSALIGLGAAPDPMSGEERPDLEQAQEAIETLLVLRAKTEGNRTEAESRLLEDILYDLQMRFVRIAKGSSPR